jgi:hypothetical protein
MHNKKRGRGVAAACSSGGFFISPKILRALFRICLGGFRKALGKIRPRVIAAGAQISANTDQVSGCCVSAP